MFWGSIAVVAATYLLSWNEGRAVSQAKGVAQGVAELATVSADVVEARNEKRLVHLIGQAASDETLRDPNLGVSATAIKLERRVEVFQWQEVAEQRSRQQADGRTTTETVYTYQTGWSDRLIVSHKFRDEAAQRDHRNPEKIEFEPWSKVAETVRVGKFSLSTRLVDQLRAFEQLPVTDDVIGRLPDDLRARAKLFNGRLHFADDPASPKVGDIRFEFRVVPATTVSVIARQVGSTFDAYPTPSGSTMEILIAGRHEARHMYHAAVQDNGWWSWFARACSLIMLVLGFGGITRTLAGLLLMVPIVSDMLHAGLRVFAWGLALTVAITTAAMSWMSLHPFVCGLMLGGLIATLYVLWRWGRRRRHGSAAATA
jgi:hypothetical protein